MKILVGCVSQLYQGDHDLGRRAAERLAGKDLGPDVQVEDLHYGAVAVAQRLVEVRPEALVLLGTAERGRPPGTVERRRVSRPHPSPLRAQPAVQEAVTGYVGIDLVVEVCGALGVLPGRTVAIEVEPALTDPSEELSPSGAAALERAVELLRLEVLRTPLFDLAERLRERVADGRLEPSPALSVVGDLVAELERLDGTGRWGATFALRDELRHRIAAGETGEGMDHLDWSLWWALIEELDRLQRTEAIVGE